MTTDQENWAFTPAISSLEGAHRTEGLLGQSVSHDIRRKIERNSPFSGDGSHTRIRRQLDLVRVSSARKTLREVLRDKHWMFG